MASLPHKNTNKTDAQHSAEITAVPFDGNDLAAVTSFKVMLRSEGIKRSPVTDQNFTGQQLEAERSVPDEISSIDTTDSSSSSTLKYGDSDLTSKRRKSSSEVPTNPTGDDPKIAEYLSLGRGCVTFHQEQYDDFKGGLLSTDMSLIQPTQQESLLSTLSSSPLPSTSSLSSHSVETADHKSAKKFNSISSTPSQTSCGYGNTFRVLEKQVRSDRNRRMYLRRISEEYVPSLSSFVVDSSSPSLPIIGPKSAANVTVDRFGGGDGDWEDHNSSRISNSCCSTSEQNPNQELTFFELELEAMQRLNEKLRHEQEEQKKSEKTTTDGVETPATAVISSPLNELLYDFVPIGLPTTNASQHQGEKGNNNEEVTLEHENEYPDLVYHISKGKDGRKYLRVVRSLLLDKVLCGNRVSQMTRAYDDIEAVTRLLEEKEKDLELTVQIGKELLTQNNRLESRITELESELKAANEDRQQLLHDLHQKNELISVLTNDVEDGSESGDTPTFSKSITLDLLQRKITSLQDENKSLKIEASQLVLQTDEVEEQERKLMEDITSQLNSANSQFDGLNLELERVKEENRLQHEQIVSLTSRLAEAEMRLHQLTAENDEQVSLLSITKENQNMLTTELAEFKSRYQEVLALLQEAQEQLRKYRKKTQPHARSTYIPGLGVPQPDSLHSELMESSLYSENSLDSGISADRMSTGGLLSGGNGTGNPAHLMMPPYRKVFETVRCAAKNGNYVDSGMSQIGMMALSSSSQPRMTALPFLSSATSNSSSGGGSASLYHRPSSVYSGSTLPSFESSSMGAKTISCESLASQSDDGCYPSQPDGVPGAPGAKDLEAALKRLTPAEVLVRRAMLSHAPVGTYSYDENPQTGLPLGIRTPDSIMSTGSSGLSNSSSTNPWRLPEKLQIVKPMEGSQTLHHWSKLATPTLSGLLEERPGVTIRGGRGLEELGLQIYSLSDVEEDVDDYPGKQFQPSGCIYTYTNSTVMHPDDGTQPFNFLSQSQMSSRIASNTTSRQPSCPPTPRTGLSRRNSCSTFSVNMGLASMLNERGIKAVTPSAINTPAGPNYSPTVTPCNSPEGSPTRSMSPEPLFGILSSGADLIRRKLMGDVERSSRSHQHQQQQHNKQQKILLSRLERRALRSLRLVEKVESIGLENIIATQPNAMSQLACGIASRNVSPMAQLTSLKNLHPSNGPLDDLQFNREQIRAVLNKGLSHDSLKSLAGGDSGSDTGISVTSSNNDDNSEQEQRVQIVPSSSSTSTSSSSYTSALNKELEEKTSKSSSTSLRTATAAALNNDYSTTAAASSASATAVATAQDMRLRQMQRQKSRRNLKNGFGGQRPDLGTVGGERIRPDLGRVINNNNNHNNKVVSNNSNKVVDSKSSSHHKVTAEEKTSSSTQQSMTQSFVGSISSLFFGRKGGWL